MVDLTNRAEDDLGEEPLLVGEVLVDGLFGDGGQGGHLVHGGAEITAAEEDRSRRLHDRLALPCRASLLYRIGFAVCRRCPGGRWRDGHRGSLLPTVSVLDSPLLVTVLYRLVPYELPEHSVQITQEAGHGQGDEHRGVSGRATRA